MSLGETKRPVGKVHPRGHGPPLHRQTLLRFPVIEEAVPVVRPDVRGTSGDMLGRALLPAAKEQEVPRGSRQILCL